MDSISHKDTKQWHAPTPFHLMLWLDERISTVSFAVKKPWIAGGGDMPFALVLKLRRANRPFIWLKGMMRKDDGNRLLQLSATAEKQGETASVYVTDCLKAYSLSVGDFFQLLVQYGFDQYRFADPGDGRHWIFKFRKFLLDRNCMVYLDEDKTPLEICSPWWDEVDDGLFEGNPEIGPLWGPKEGKERFEVVKRCLAEAST